MHKYTHLNYLLFITFSSIFLMNSAYAGCAGGGGGSAAIETSNTDAIAAMIKQKHPDITPPTSSTQSGTPQPVVAKVVWTKGTVKVMGPDKKVRVLQENSEIHLNDTIISDPNSQAEIVYSDNTIMTFKDKTVFYIDKYEYHPEVKEGSKGKYIMDLIQGGYRTVTGTIAKSNPADYQVNTEVALMGVRGTDYSAYFGACKVSMQYHSGTPILHNEKGTIILTNENPYASVPAFNAAPVVLKQQPIEFKVPLPVTPATFKVSSVSDKTLTNVTSKIVPSHLSTYSWIMGYE